MATVPRVLMVVCEEDSGARSAKKVVKLCSSGSEDTSVSVMIVKFCWYFRHSWQCQCS